MNIKTSLCAIGTFIITSSISGVSDAALYSRLNGQAYYDDVLNVTWIADANFAASKTFGLGYNVNLGQHPTNYTQGNFLGADYTIHTNGQMGWDAASHWIDAMNNANYLDTNDWRLPQIVDGGCVYAASGSDCGYNVNTGSASELADLWMNTLGNLPYFSPTSGVYDGPPISPSNPAPSPQPGWGLSNTGPFINMTQGTYWSGLQDPANNTQNSLHSRMFVFNSGFQGIKSKLQSGYVLAVRSGDIALTAVPIPPSLLLFTTGILGLLGFLKRHK
jgi:hypothetical protein